MNALLILIPVSLLLIVAAAGIFFWAVRHSQFDDLDTPKIMPLLDDENPGPCDQGSVEQTTATGD